MSTEATRARRHALASRSRMHERGMSLVELLLATSLLILISVFLLGGISTVRHGFQQERRAQVLDQANDAAQAVSRLVEIAYPVVSDQDRKHPFVRFDGRPDTLTFIALGDGRSLRGGLHSIEMHLDGDTLVADVTPTREGANAEVLQATRRVILRQGVGTLRFAYYGSTHKGEKQAWRSDWIKADVQPRLMSIEIVDSLTGGRVTALATLRQR